MANNYAASASSLFSGAGTNLWTGGIITINGSVTTTNSLLAGAGLGGSGSISGGLTWISGTFAADGTLTIATNGVLTINGSTTLQMFGALTNAGTVNWVGGTFVLNNANGANGGYIAGINNLSGALFDAQCDQAINCGCYGFEYFNNAGTVRKSGSANTTVINVLFKNTGTVDVRSGTLNLDGSGAGGGSFIAEAGATLAMGNNYTASVGSLFSGAGTNLWIGGTVTIDGAVTTANSVLAGAGLNGSGSFSSEVTWISGSFAAGGTLTIATNGVLTMNGSTTLQVFGALTNAGTVNWLAGAVVINNANSGNGGCIGGINNLPGAVFNAQCDQSIACGCYGSEYFNNAGLLRKWPTTGTTTINVPFSNNAGTLDIESGSLSLTSSRNLAGGILNFGITSVTNFGSLNLSGASSLAGSLRRCQ